jgi:hypothetical protein
LYAVKILEKKSSIFKQENSFIVIDLCLRTSFAVTRILDLKINGIADVIEKGVETGARLRSVVCLATSVSRFRKERVSSGVVASSSLSLNSSEKGLKRNSQFPAYLFFE